MEQCVPNMTPYLIHNVTIIFPIRSARFIISERMFATVAWPLARGTDQVAGGGVDGGRTAATAGAGDGR